MHIKKHIHLFGLLFITLLAGLIAQNNLKKTDGYNTPFVFDADQYYSIVPSAIIYGDIAYTYDTSKHWDKYYPEGMYVPCRYWTTEYLPGKRMTMATLGMPYAYSLFFIPAYLYEKVFPAEEKYAPGYSPTYVFAVKLFGLILACVFVFLIFTICKRYTSNWLAVFIALLILFGTNCIYYFFGEPLMTHAFQGILIAAFSVLSLLILIDGRYKLFPLIVFIAAWLALIRPTDILIGIFPLVLLINKGSRQNLLRAVSSIKNILLSVSLVLIVIIPQLLYWKYITGSYIVYSYKEEGFYFNQFNLINFWFSARKGWFIYSPVCLIIMLLGLRDIFKQKLVLASTLVICIVSLLYAQWWCWWYGGSFGMRTMVQFTPLLALILALYFGNEKPSTFKRIVLVVLTFLVPLNIFLARSFHLGNLHYDSMTISAWNDLFFKEEPFDKYANYLHPDYKGARHSGVEFENIRVFTKSNISNSNIDVIALVEEINSEGYLVVKCYHEKSYDNTALVLKVYDRNGFQIHYDERLLNFSSFNEKEQGYNMMEFNFEKYHLEGHRVEVVVYNPDKQLITINKLELTLY